MLLDGILLEARMKLILLLDLVPLAHRRTKLRRLTKSLPAQLGHMVHLAQLHVLVVIVLLITLDLLGPLVLAEFIFVLFALVEALENS